MDLTRWRFQRWASLVRSLVKGDCALTHELDGMADQLFGDADVVGVEGEDGGADAVGGVEALAVEQAFEEVVSCQSNRYVLPIKQVLY